MDSLLSQDFRDFEVIIADDSTDDEIEKYIGSIKDDRIDYVHNKKRLGHIFNWNATIDRAQGEYIKIMFADDWFNSGDALGKYVKLLDDNPDAVMAFSSNIQYYIDHPGDNFQRHIPEDFVKKLKDDYRYVFTHNAIGAPSVTIYRRSSGVRFDEKSTCASDVFLYMELLKDGGGFVYTDEPLICIGIHGDQYTNTFLDNVEEVISDRRYLYEKYDLHESSECKEHFKNEYLLKNLKSTSYAAECGYDKHLYARDLAKARKERFLFYVDVLKRKLRMSKRSKQ